MTTLALKELADRKLAQARIQTQLAIKQFQETLQTVKKAEQLAQCEIKLPELLIEEVLIADTQMENANYLQILEIERRIIANRREVIDVAVQNLGEIIMSKKATLEKLEKDIEWPDPDYSTRLREIHNSLDKSSFLLFQEQISLPTISGLCVLLLILWLLGFFNVTMFIVASVIYGVAMFIVPLYLRKRAIQVHGEKKRQAMEEHKKHISSLEELQSTVEVSVQRVE